MGPGTAALNALIGWTDTLQRSGAPGLKSEELVGLAGGFVGNSLPEWKASVRAGYRWANVETAVQWRYVDSMRDANFPDEWTVPSRDYFDVFVSLELAQGWLDALRLNLGIENVTDTSPPIFPSYVQANTDPSQYDTLGRRYFARATYRF
jgi:outer membrane receptor protein involved in Fe transport